MPRFGRRKALGFSAILLLFITFANRRSHDSTLAFDAAEDYTLREDALREEEQQDGRDDHQHRDSHDQVRVDGVDRVEGLQADGESPVFARVQENQRLIEIIPGIEEMEDPNGDKRRPRLRQNNIQQNLQWIGAIDLRGIIQLQRDGHEELAEQEDIVGIGEELWHDQRQECIHPAESLEENIDRESAAPGLAA